MSHPVSPTGLLNLLTAAILGVHEAARAAVIAVAMEAGKAAARLHF